jgi:hypothetical protein
MRRFYRAIIVFFACALVVTIRTAAAKDKGSPDVTKTTTSAGPVPLPYPNGPTGPTAPSHGPRSEPQYPLGPRPATATKQKTNKYIGETEQNLRR